MAFRPGLFKPLTVLMVLTHTVSADELPFIHALATLAKRSLAGLLEHWPILIGARRNGRDFP